MMKTHKSTKILAYERQIVALIGSSEIFAKAVWRDLLDYYETKDCLENTRHREIIDAVYNRRQPTALKHIALSVDLNLSERTLYRYRKEYLQCLEHLLSVRGLSLEDIADFLDEKKARERLSAPKKLG